LFELGFELQILTRLAFSIPELIGKLIEKECNGIFPLSHVYIRKVKMLKAPKFDRE